MLLLVSVTAAVTVIVLLHVVVFVAADAFAAMLQTTLNDVVADGRIGVPSQHYRGAFLQSFTEALTQRHRNGKVRMSSICKTIPSR